MPTTARQMSKSANSHTESINQEDLQLLRDYRVRSASSVTRHGRCLDAFTELTHKGKM